MTVTPDTEPALLRLAECEPDGTNPPPLAPQQAAFYAENAAETAPPAPRRAELLRLVRLLLEVLDARRPVAQLRDRLGEDALFAVHQVLRSTGSRVSRRTSGPPHVSRPSARVIELCTTIREGNRHRAVVARLELRGHRWLCTRFHLL